LAQFLAHPNEVEEIACIDPVETAADKLAALSWRVFNERHLPGSGENERDRALVRHVHDLRALEGFASSDERFSLLVRELLVRDMKERGRKEAKERPRDLDELMKEMCTLLSDPPFPEDYERFVESVSYSPERTGYAEALAAVGRLVTAVQRDR
jgi:hypothetical protein